MLLVTLGGLAPAAGLATFETSVAAATSEPRGLVSDDDKDLVYSEEHRIVRDPITGDLWQLSPEEFQYFMPPAAVPEPAQPKTEPQPDKHERLAPRPLTVEGNQLSVDGHAGATNGVPPGQGEGVNPVESRRGSGTIGRSRIGAGAAGTLPMALIATILGYGVSRLLFRRRIASRVVLIALLTCWMLVTSLHVLLGDRFFSENLLNVMAMMAAIAAVVIGLLTPNSAGKEKTVPPMQIAASSQSAQEKAGETTRLSLSSGGDDEDAMYEKAWAEITAGSPKAAVWARAYAESDGDDSKTRAAYIRLRVSELKSNRSSD